MSLGYKMAGQDMPLHRLKGRLTEEVRALSVHFLASEGVTGPGLQGHLKIVYPEAKSHWRSPPETTTNTPLTTVWF